MAQSIKFGAVNDISTTSAISTDTIDVLANDLGTPRTLKSLSGATSALGAKISIVNGKVLYDPTNDPTFIPLAAGQTIVDTFSYTMTEPGRGSFTAKVSVTVTGVNDLPTITGTYDHQRSDTDTYNPFNTTVIADPDNGAQDSLVISIRDSNGNLTDDNGSLSLSGLNLSHTGVGTYSLSATNPASLTSEVQALVWTPTAHQGPAGSVIDTTITLTASDGLGGVATDSGTTIETAQTAPTTPPSNQILGYNTTILTVPNAGNTLQHAIVSDINDSNEVVGDYSLQGQQPVGFTDINGHFNAFLVPGSTATEVQKVNNHGDIAGFYDPATGGEATFVQHNGVVIDIPLSATNVTGLNDKGQVAVLAEDQNGATSWIYDENTGNVTPITVTGSSEVVVNDINNNGVAVGEYDNPVTGHSSGFIFDTNANSFLSYDAPGVSDTNIKAINDSGAFAGQTDTFDSNGNFIGVGDFLDIGGDFSTIPGMSIVEGINNNNVVVGNNGSNAVVYGGSLTGNQSINANPNNYLGDGTSINNNNVIGGYVEPPGGSQTSNAIFATPITT
jgi:VCBS repeat-containing protein